MENEKNILEVASPDSDQRILDFYSRQSMEGDISLSMNRFPSYFSSVEVEGREVAVIVARGEKSHEVRAVGQISGKTCYFNHKPDPQPIGYLSSLRVDAAAQGSFVLFKCFKYLKLVHQQRKFADLYLTTIMEDNQKAQSILQSKRAGLPTYNDFGLVHSYLLKVGTYRWSAKESEVSPLTVRKAGEQDIEMILNFLNKTGAAQRQFFPAYTKKDILSPHGLLKGFDIDNLFLCFEKDKLVGTLGVWNQSSFRRWLVKSYSKRFAMLRPLYNGLARLRGRPRLPKAGENFDYSFLSLICIKDDSPRVFMRLMNEVWQSLKESPNSVISIGLHRDDPLRPLVSQHPHLELKSRLFVVHWEEGQEVFESIDSTMVPYIELGSL